MKLYTLLGILSVMLVLLLAGCAKQAAPEEAPKEMAVPAPGVDPDSVKEMVVEPDTNALQKEVEKQQELMDEPEGARRGGADEESNFNEYWLENICLMTTGQLGTVDKELALLNRYGYTADDVVALSNKYPGATSYATSHFSECSKFY